jgi:hypothetical protein
VSALASLVAVGGNANVIWEFAAGVLAVYLVAALIVSGVTAIRRLLEL